MCSHASKRLSVPLKEGLQILSPWSIVCDDCNRCNDMNMDWAVAILVLPGRDLRNGFASEAETLWCKPFLAFFVKLWMADRLWMIQPPLFRQGEQSSRVVMAGLSNHER